MNAMMMVLAGMTGMTSALVLALGQPQRLCPECRTPLPRVNLRDARSRWWGGWICATCGSEIDRRGRKVA